MVQLLPESPSFGTAFARGMGQGLQQGASRGLDFLAQMKLEKHKQQQRQKLIEGIEGSPSQSFSEQVQPKKSESQKRELFLNALPEIEEQIGRELTSQDLDELWSSMQEPAATKSKRAISEDPFAKAKQYAAAGEHDLAQTAVAEAKAAQKRSDIREGRHFDIARKTLESNAAKAELLPQKETALDTMKSSIAEGNLGFFTPDNLAEITGIEGLRSPEGAAFKTASKEFFMGTLSRIGAKGLNQYLEKQVASMAPQLGRSTLANLVVTEIMDADLALEKKQIELTNRIASEQEEEYGHPLMSLSQDVMKELSPFAIDLQNQTKEKIENLKSRYEPKNAKGYLMRAPDGSLRRVGKDQVAEAKKAGYKVEK